MKWDNPSPSASAAEPHQGKAASSCKILITVDPKSIRRRRLSHYDWCFLLSLPNAVLAQKAINHPYEFSLIESLCVKE